MPGVLILEAMAQTAAMLAKKSRGGIPPECYVLLVGIDNVRFKRQVIPGDTLRIEAKFIKHRKPLWIIDAEATVDGELVASGRLSAIQSE